MPLHAAQAFDNRIIAMDMLILFGCITVPVALYLHGLQLLTLTATHCNISNIIA